MVSPRLTAPTAGTTAPLPLPGQNPSSIPGATPLDGSGTSTAPPAAPLPPPIGTGHTIVPPPIGSGHPIGDPPPPPPGAPDYTTPEGQTASVQGWLNSGPNQTWKSQAAYFTQRVNETGGFTPENIAYWQKMIAAGMTPDEAAGGSGGSGSGAVAGGQQPAVQNAPFLKAFQDALSGQLKYLTDPSQSGVNDPNVQPQIAANHLSTARGLEDTNNTIAEQAYASGGLQDGGFGVAKQKAAEDASANEANFTGSAVAANSQMRQQALMSLLGIGNSQTGMALQQQQGNDQLGYNYAALMNLMNNQSTGQILNPTGGGA